jgi:hypothetical protein
MLVGSLKPLTAIGAGCLEAHGGWSSFRGCRTGRQEQYNALAETPLSVGISYRASQALDTQWPPLDFALVD